MNIYKQIPNAFTLLNLLCGCLAIICLFNTHIVWASYLIGIAVICDFLDGFFARLLKATSETGKQLDSFADFISFGIVPGIMLFQFISIGFKEYFTDITQREISHLLLSLTGFGVTIFSALRLAKFNIDYRQTTFFIGLPTPANAIFIASLPLITALQFNLNLYYPIANDAKEFLIKNYIISAFDLKVATVLYNPYFYICIAFVMSFLLVSPFTFFSLKFKNIKWKENKIRYFFIATSLGIIAYSIYSYNFFEGIPFVLLWYIVISLFVYLFNKKILN